MKKQWTAPKLHRIACPALVLAIAITAGGAGQIVTKDDRGSVVYHNCKISGTMTVRPPAIVKPGL